MAVNPYNPQLGYPSPYQTPSYASTESRLEALERRVRELEESRLPYFRDVSAIRCSMCGQAHEGGTCVLTTGAKFP